MLHAVIIVDELNGMRSLELLITKFINGVNIVAATTDPLQGVELINNYRPDVVFLDIQMPNLSGFELLEKLRFREFYLVFTTAHSEYGLRAIKQSATDYLLKPVGLLELEQAVARINNKIQEKQRVPDAFEGLRQIYESQRIRIAIPVKAGVEYLLPNDIAFMEANSNSTIVHCAEGEKLLAYKTLKEYELQLCKTELSFIRIHNSFIINLNHVTRYLKEDGGYAVLQGKKTIPVSQHKKEQFLKLINLK